MTNPFHRSRIVLAAYGEVGTAALFRLQSLGFAPSQLALMTHPSDRRNQSLLAAAAAARLEIWTDPAGAQSLQAAVSAFAPDVLLSMHYREKIPAQLLGLATCGGVNLHPSLLPDYRGCFSIPWALINGEDAAGYTYHFMTEKFDQGNIVIQKRHAIGPGDTAFSLFHRINWCALERLGDVLRAVILDRSEGTAQPGGGRYFGRALPFDGRVDPAWPEDRIDRFIRAMTFPPHKGAVVATDGGDVEVSSMDDYRRVVGAPRQLETQ